jgi:hypothetical protein
MKLVTMLGPSLWGSQMDELILEGKLLVGQQPVALRRYLNTRRASFDCFLL